MKYKPTILVVLFTLVSTFIFSQENWQTFETETFAINYPEDWSYSDNKPNPMVQAVFFSPEITQVKDQFRENVNLTVEDLKSVELNIQEYTKLALDQVEKQISSAKILNQSSTTISGLEARIIIWSADFGNGILLKLKQLYTISNGKAYVLTFSSTIAEYDEYSEIGDNILKSFKLLNT
ncbi:hypothetical protein [Olleya sp. YS]|uniref:PsbP-related protein n=1 Tax=Olleya sp. YS TaxID=3028318 RepID=UPI0024343B39|nr:hypothetical protein [Olleya sp. YS]WGD33697.1 hypothetical protein Ollyesu_07890 [Olleya sp. YS]